MESKEEHLKKWERSGASKRAYARQQGINRNTFYGWFRGKPKAAGAEVNGLVELTMKRSETVYGENKEARISLVTRNGYRLELPDGYGRDEVNRLLDILEAR